MPKNKVKKGPFRGDHVGSLLRTDRIKQVREQFVNNEISKEDLRNAENEEIKQLIEKQKEIGLSAVTDGEFRREYWHLDFIKQLSGILTYEEEAPGFFQGSMKKLKKYLVNGKLSFPKDHPFLEDFTFVKETAGDHVAKFTIPGPNMILHSGIVANPHYIKNPIYPSITEAAQDVAQVYRDAIQAFYAAGCRYLQLDDTSWGALFSKDFRALIEANGYDAQEVTQLFADTTVKALEEKPYDMAITIHICRGNFKSSWLYEGDYEPIAKDLFSRVNVDAFFLEFDSDRAGDFTPLRFIQNQKVVLGLITTKTAELEDKAEIKKRIEEAAAIVPKEQLCISPQCGFASTEEGNLITEEDQWNKLRLVLDIADEVWGEI